MSLKTTNMGIMLKRYGFYGFVRLIFDLLITRIFFPTARIIRRPFYIRGMPHISLGKGFTSGVGLRIDAFSSTNGKVVKIGENVEVNDYLHIGAIDSVVIGNNVLIASKVFISDHNHGEYSRQEPSSPDEPPSERKLSSSPVEIGDNVWIGEGVAVLPGVKIGRGSIIGSNSVITHSVPPETIWVGNPARQIKAFDRKSRKWISTK